MISESGSAVAATWNRNRLAYERKELAGDEKFFDLLDETLNDPSDEASQRLWSSTPVSDWDLPVGMPVSLNTCEARCWISASGSGPRWKRTRQCGSARKLILNVDTRDLVQAPASKLGGIAIVFAGLCLIVVTVEAYLFHAASLSLTDSLTAIGSQEISK